MEQFDAVLQACGYSEYHRDIIRPYYNDALEYIMDAGVPEAIAKSEKAIGCIARYILDTYTLNGNTVDLSPFFFRRLKQLQTKGAGADAEEQES